ncbi:MAG: hypothetical protein PVH40_00670 [Gemmatimonadales bacterium]
MSAGTAVWLRRVLHMGSAACLLCVPFGSWGTFRAIVIAGAVLAVGFEAVRLNVPSVHAWLERWVPVFRQAEARRPSGAMWLAVGYATAALFPEPGPAAGVLVAAFADPAASWVGGTGSRSGGKTWRGTVVHLGVALAVLLLAGLPLERVVMASVVGTALERWPGPFNDNLIVAPAVAASVSLIG